MLSVHQIDRHFSLGRYDQLLDAVAANGMALPMSLKVRLSSSPAAAVAAGLVRVADLTYGPTPLSRAMTAALIDMQHTDGSFDRDPLVTAMAVAALAHVADMHGRAGQHPQTAPAQANGVAALAAMQDADSLFRSEIDRTRQDRELVGAYVLFMLAGHDLFRMNVRYADLMSYFEAGQARMDDATDRIWRMARLDTPAAAATHAPAYELTGNTLATAAA